jgi:threonine/homoserine efflux transporter RhtA
MVYIDVRDRKFQLMVVLPIALAAVFGILVIADQPDQFDLVGILIAIVAAIAFILFLVLTIVTEKLRERGESGGGETEPAEAE